MDLGSTPGLVCGHHHLYSALARGMPAPPGSTQDFRRILEQVWWRLDTALDLDMLEWSAKLGALEALEVGCTAIVDHHESPNAIEGSLDVIAAAGAEVGVRVTCSYATSDRLGAKIAEAGVAENARFLADGGEGMVGLLAPFACSNDTIDASLAVAERASVGVHATVAESTRDAGPGVALARRADVDWVLAHGVHLPDGIDFDGTIVHCPRSNQFHGTGYAFPARFTTAVALGTDGFGPDLIAEFQAAFLKEREIDLTAGPDRAWGWLEGGWELEPAARDDVVTWSLSTMDADHAGRASSARAVEVVIDDETVLRDGQATRVDGAEVRARAAEQAARLLARL